MSVGVLCYAVLVLTLPPTLTALPPCVALFIVPCPASRLVQWDAEVRDRALGLVEDFGRGLPMPAYKEAYESLLVRLLFVWG